MNKHVKNELDPRLLATSSMNPLKEHVSASREMMFATHLGQMLVLNGSTPRSLQSGAERDFGKYTFRIEMPCDGTILDIIERYPYTEGFNSIPENPETLVFYEDDQTREIGYFSLVRYCSNHQYFGFKYVERDAVNQIRIGARIKKGTVFMDSPSVTTDGDYCYGVEANVVFMTHPAVAEDGIVVSRDFLPKMGFRIYETRVVEWGKDMFALNLYGDAKNPKPFPEIGHPIRDDGVVVGLRSYELPELAVVEQSVIDSMIPDYTFDTLYYATPGGKVVDVKIHHHLQDTNTAPVHMDEQAQRYDQANRKYTRRILDFWKSMNRKRGTALVITPALQRLVGYAQSVCSDEGDVRIHKIYHKTPINLYRAEITIEYEIIPTTGFKATTAHGGKHLN